MEISFDEINEKEFLENGSFISINNDSFLLSNDLMRKSTIESKLKIESKQTQIIQT